VDTSAPPYRTAIYTGVVLLLALVLLLPVALTNVAPLVDYPAHVARIHILKDYEGSPALQTFYALNWAYQANLAFDVVGRYGLVWLDAPSAGRVFLGMALILNFAGVLLVHRVVHGRTSAFPLLVVLFLYNRILLGGLINYLFTLGLAFVFFAIWLAARERAWPWPLKMLAATAGALVLYFGHLTAFGVFALLVGGYEIDAFFRDRDRAMPQRLLRLIASGLVFVPPIAVALFLSASTQQPTTTYYGSLAQKLTAPMNLFYAYNLPFDAASFAAVLLVLGGMAALRQVRVAPRLALPVGLLVLAYLLTPNVLFDSHGADRRLTIAIAQAGLCMLDWAAPVAAGRRRAQQAATALLLALFLVRTAFLAQHWHQADRVYVAYLVAFDQLPRGARLSVVVGHPFAETTVHPPLNFVGTLAVVRRDAFVPNLWANPAHQSVVMRPPFLGLAQAGPPRLLDPPVLARIAADPAFAARANPYAPANLAGYDHLLVSRGSAIPFPEPPADTAGLREIARGPDFRLYAIDGAR
jgi:hypothetical protein